MIDIHSHILPGIDDGARTFEDSIEIVRELASQGITDVIATPHYANETSYMSPCEYNESLLLELKKGLVAEGIKVNIYLGNEIYIDGQAEEFIKAGKVSALAGSKYLLVELPLHEEYQSYEDILGSLMDAGYKVILAHPERYEIVQKDYGVVEDLYKMGILLQCNVCSILGKYGKDAKKLVRRLAKDKMIFAFGSDIHRCSHSDQLKRAQKKIARYYNDQELEKVLVKNPRKILA